MSILAYPVGRRGKGTITSLRPETILVFPPVLERRGQMLNALDGRPPVISLGPHRGVVEGWGCWDLAAGRWP